MTYYALRQTNNQNRIIAISENRAEIPKAVTAIGEQLIRIAGDIPKSANPFTSTISTTGVIGVYARRRRLLPVENQTYEILKERFVRTAGVIVDSNWGLWNSMYQFQPQLTRRSTTTHIHFRNWTWLAATSLVTQRASVTEGGIATVTSMLNLYEIEVGKGVEEFLRGHNTDDAARFRAAAREWDTSDGAATGGIRNVSVLDVYNLLEPLENL